MQDTCEAEVVGTLNMDCACCICFQPPILESAVVVLPCHHLFCRECLTQAVSQRAECPVDRHSIGREDIVAPDDATLRAVRNVQVQCSMRHRGCSWEGTWGEWSDARHGASCSFRPTAPCSVPGCSTTAGMQPPTHHDESHAHHHIRLLSEHIVRLEHDNRRLQVESDQLKERLYGLQNDVAELHHKVSSSNDAMQSFIDENRHVVSVIAEDLMVALPQFCVPAVQGSSCSAPQSPHGALGSTSVQRWDHRCRSRHALLDGATLTHAGGTSRGWATAFASAPIVAHRNHGTGTVSATFRVSRNHDNSESVPFHPSMVMVGLASHRHAGVPTSLHIGALGGCFALQASGFVWDGDAKLCGTLGENAAFGLGDAITFSLDAVDDKVKVQCRVNGDRHIGEGAVLSFPAGRTTLPLFPVASLGASCCSLELLAVSA